MLVSAEWIREKLYIWLRYKGINKNVGKRIVREGEASEGSELVGKH